ncbi:dTDP-glucose 4,6-dehydratase [Teredinibacter sp. KSP-S5-2]|uniref:dTDP-glucose 4,6-dehydratase n=1 Tax=Teredinibacter sp. KSP-S5-2 TaxID=3034506 RepID=UPI00293417AD|nr:dTDP-glucose 4,6-dehydratase [Teredinibacter sp. KSP-S5-2]WNO08156.1 dTDP-glucose 4,6-dehydratase [Teredinibacter sp. KSP-S5-2]
MYKQLLITGGAGFIGSNFVAHWLAQHPHTQVTILDLLTYAGNMANLQSVADNPNLSFVRGDIGDKALVSSLFAEKDFDCVVHFAAESHVDRSIEEPDIFLKTNVLGTHNLLECAKQHWLYPGAKPRTHLFHHVSTDEVFGSLQPGESPFTEENNYKPNSPYSASKAASDHLVRAYHNTYQLNTSICHCCNAFGPHQHTEKLIPKTIHAILSNKTIPVYGDGLQIRDWMYVHHTVEAIERIITKGEKGEAYNVGYNQEKTNMTLIGETCSLMDKLFADNTQLQRQFPEATKAAEGKSKELISHVEDRLGHDRRYAINANKLSAHLNFSQTGSFEENLLDTIRWFIQQHTKVSTIDI